MAKRRYEFDEKKRERFEKEGRGKGHGKDYKPWLTVQDVPSSGLASRALSRTANRLHHLMSKIEFGPFLMADWADSVVDIREQFPLDRDVTRMIAQEMGVPHPSDPKSGVDIVMTTDLVIDFRLEGKRQIGARSIKPASELDKRRVLEKLEIERRYWEREGDPWFVITEKDLPRVRIKNLRWLHEMVSLERLAAPHESYWRDRCQEFIGEFTRVRGGLIKDFLEHLEHRCGFDSGEPMTVLRHLAANKRIVFDIDTEFSDTNSISFLAMADGASTRRESA